MAKQSASVIHSNMRSSQYSSPGLLQRAQLEEAVSGIVHSFRANLEVSFMIPLRAVQYTLAGEHPVNFLALRTQAGAVVTRVDGLMNATVNSSTLLKSQEGFVMTGSVWQTIENYQTALAKSQGKTGQY